MAEHLITQAGPLLNEDGTLREPGYAFSPLLTYNRDDIAAHPLRIKDWDYYLVNDDEFAVALTFSDLGYIGLVSASVLDFAERSFTTTSELLVLPFGRMGVPRDSEVGDIVWSNDRCDVRFVHDGDARRLSFGMKRFRDEEELEVELLLDQPPRDSMVIATPWPENPRAFYYNRKILAMRAQGAFRVGGSVHEFSAADSFGLLDWGRGVWTYDNVWYWAAAQGRQDGHVVGLNLGYGFGNTSAASENMLFVDGIAHKLGRVDFGIPFADEEAGTFDYMAPWHMTDDEGRLDLTFTPEIDRTDFIDIAHVVISDQHQVFGKLDGFVVLDDGTRMEIRGLRGSSEHIHNRY